MMGLGLAGFSFTPQVTGTLLVWIAGVVRTATAIVANPTVTGKFGTGGAPSNGAGVSGTTFGAAQTVDPVVAGAGGGETFILMGRLSGLTLGVAVWFDVALATGNAADTSTIINTQFVVHEVG